jgi:hypothetical protein
VESGSPPASIPKNYAAAADYVAKILSGVKPGDLPIQQPAFYELVINRRVTSDLNFDVPTYFKARYAAECRLNLRSKTIHSGHNSNGDPGGDEAVFNANATRGRRPSHSALCC